MIEAATYYEVSCDEPGCQKNLFDVTTEVSAMAERDQAESVWEDAGGVIVRNDVGTAISAYCYDHVPDEEEEE